MSDETIIADVNNISILKPSRRKRPCLVQYSGDQLGKIYHIEKESITIGRSKTEDIVIVEASVSRQHARVNTRGDDTIEVEDLGSSNGTLVNHEKLIGKIILKDSDFLQIGNVLFKYCASSNIDALIQDKIYRMATIDEGTKIYNKKYLLQNLESEIRYSRSSRLPLSIIYYDLDFFKKVNDSYGHNAGDVILYESSQLVKSVVRKDDILGRFGGEEFVIILPATDIKAAYDLAERIRIAIESHSFALDIVQGEARKKVMHKQTISMGVSQLKEPMQTPEDFLEDADQKLYLSKQTGRNKITA